MGQTGCRFYRNQGTPQIVRYSDKYINFSTFWSLGKQFTPLFQITGLVGASLRSPDINERFSNGLHQGVSGIEKGNLHLQQEKLVKASLDWIYQISNHLKVENHSYFHHYFNYLFLQPQDSLILTIRGAFPFFNYQETKAQFIGNDVEIETQIGSNINLRMDFSYLRPYNISQKQTLPFLPANKARSSLSLNVFRSRNIKKDIQATNGLFEINNTWVLQQNKDLAHQDYLPPPKAYFLTGVKFGNDFKINNIKGRFNFQIENIFNLRYRNYLNRLRYFADEIGRNTSVGIRVYL